MAEPAIKNATATLRGVLMLMGEGGLAGVCCSGSRQGNPYLVWRLRQLSSLLAGGCGKQSQGHTVAFTRKIMAAVKYRDRKVYAMNHC